MTEILVTGTTTYANNRGVSAMASSTIKVIENFFPQANVTIWHTFPESYTRKSPTTNQTNVRILKDDSKTSYLLKLPMRMIALPIALFLSRLDINMNKLLADDILKDYLKADLIISLNFGDTLTDNYGYKQSLIILMQNMLNLMSGKTVIFFPQTIGSFNTLFTKSIAKYILNKSHLIMAREPVTFKYLLNLGVNKHLVRLVPDSAFLLGKSNDERVQQILHNEGLADKSSRLLIGISVSPAMAKFSGQSQKQEEYIHIICLLVEYLIDKMNAIVIFVPNVTVEPSSVPNRNIDTRSLGNYIISQIQREDDVISINGEYTAEELKGIIGKCDLFIASLTHTFIAAISLCIPTVAIAYGPKTAGIMSLFGLEKYVVDFKDLDFETLISKINDAWESRENIKKTINLKIDGQNEKMIDINMYNFINDS